MTVSFVERDVAGVPVVEKHDLPVHRARAFLEPGSILLVTSCHDGERNVMTMGWHMVLEFTPSLVGCMISAAIIVSS
ncbi:hypothetical protein ACFSLT_28790 [Novosphingobium resinovorum]